MPRTYTHAALTLWTFLLLVLPSIVSAHMIEVPAGKKECFFEDLHKNDKVRQHIYVYAKCHTKSTSTDDCNLPSWRWWTLGHRLLGMYVVASVVLVVACAYMALISWQTQKATLCINTSSSLRALSQ